MDSLAVKVCTKCGEGKPLEAFGPHKASKSGFRCCCKKCHAAQAKERYARNPERITEINLRSYQKHRAARLAQKKTHQRELASDPAWVEKRRTTSRIYAAEKYQRNPEPARQAQKAYRVRHLEKVKMRSKASYTKYYEKNADKYKARAAQRRALLLTIPGKWTAQDVRDLFLRQSSSCFYCGVLIDQGQRRTWHVDHFIPISRGGSNFPENLAIACQPCNATKYNKMPWEFMPDKFPALT